MGRQADPRVAGAVPARGDLRGAGGAGAARPGRCCARNSGTCCSRCCSTPGWPPSAPTAPGSRSTTWPRGSQASWCAGTRMCSRDVAVSGADEVKANWDAIKARERAEAGGGPVSALDGVPMGQPALSLAAQLQRRAERAGAPAALADLPVADLPGAASSLAPSRSARSAASCSRWSSGPGPRAWTPSLSCGGPPGCSAIGCGSGSRRAVRRRRRPRLRRRLRLRLRLRRSAARTWASSGQLALAGDRDRGLTEIARAGG